MTLLIRSYEYSHNSRTMDSGANEQFFVLNTQQFSVHTWVRDGNRDVILIYLNDKIYLIFFSYLPTL